MQLLGALLEETRHLVLRDGVDGLRPSHYRVIDNVPADGGISITELAERVGMTKQGIGQFVAQLTEAGYLVTETDPDDRRLRIVRRTPQGHDAARRLRVMLSTLEADWSGRVGTPRYRAFRAALDEITRSGGDLA